MSGVPFLVRISATLESRLASSASPSPSSASSPSCRQARHKSNLGRAENRARRSAGWRRKSLLYARLYTSQSLLDPLSQQCRREGASLRSVRAWSSTAISSYTPKPTLEDEAYKDNWGGGGATSSESTETKDKVNQTASLFNQQSTARIGQVELLDDMIIGHEANLHLKFHNHEGESNSYYKVLLKNSLQRKRASGILRAIVATSEDSEYIRSIPDTTFSEILRLIQPKRIIQWADIIRKSLTPHMIMLMEITPPDDAVRTYLYTVLKIVTDRTKAGKHLNVNDYAFLLGTAHKARSKNVAKAFWQSMQSENVTPDLRCYNHYLGAIANNAGNDSIALHRVTPFNMMARSHLKPGKNYVDYAVGEGGIKEECVALLDHMLANETSPDAETYSSIIIAAAREGDVGMVERILKSTWGVDVFGLMNNVDESQLSPRIDIKQTSPLYPTANLLYAIAHAFSINNDISTALRVVDYVSRIFDLVILEEVWEELFTWTFVLTLKRTRKERFTDGELPKHKLMELWTTMTNPPYSIRPSVPMYDKLFKNLLTLWRPRDMWHYMQEARDLIAKHRQKTKLAFRDLKAAGELHTLTGGLSTASFEHLRATYILFELIRKRNAMMEKRWLRLLLAAMLSWRKKDKDLLWSTIQIPKILLEMRYSAPRVVEYEIPSGRVSIVFHNEFEIRESQKVVVERNRENEELVNLGPSPPNAKLRMGKRHYKWMELEEKSDA